MPLATKPANGAKSDGGNGVRTEAEALALARAVTTIVVAGGRFRLCRRLGGGAFGDVFSAVEVETGGLVAVKFEPTKSAHQPHLFHEARLYAHLGNHNPTVGFPRVRWWGREGEFNLMVMDLLGPSLEDLFDFCERSFDMKTTLMLAVQMISRLEFMHTNGFIHRDLKPENFVMGLGKRGHHVYLIDMGLAKRFRDSRTDAHVPYCDGKSLTGTARYVSRNTHLGVQQSRRDDMEGLAFVLIYFAKGSLPWQGLRCTTKADKYEQIKEMKFSIPLSLLCADIPPAFSAFMAYCRGLSFTETPDYGKCRQLFLDAMSELGFIMDYQFCWLSRSTAAQQSGAPTVVYSPVKKRPPPLFPVAGCDAVSTHATEGEPSMMASPSPSRRSSVGGAFTPSQLSPRAPGSPVHMTSVANYALFGGGVGVDTFLANAEAPEDGDCE